MQRMGLMYVASAHFRLSLCTLGSSCPSDRTEHLFGEHHCSYGNYGCWWGSGNQPMTEIAGCTGLAPCDVHLPEQVLETNYAPHKFSSMCRWFNE